MCLGARGRADRGVPGPETAGPALTWIGDERIAISGVPSARTVACLAEQCAKHFVNCRPQAQARWSGIWRPSRRVAHASMHDHGLRQRPAVWAAACFAARVLDVRPQAGVLIHCTAAGAARPCRTDDFGIGLAGGPAEEPPPPWGPEPERVSDRSGDHGGQAGAKAAQLLDRSLLIMSGNVGRLSWCGRGPSLSFRGPSTHPARTHTRCATGLISA